MTNQELSERIGLPPSPALRRLKQLESDGSIPTMSRSSTRPGLGVTAFVRVRLDQQPDGHLSLFEDAVADFPEVMECSLMTGDSDYQLRVLVENLKAFEDFLRHKLTRIEGVSQLTTSLALRPVVYKIALPFFPRSRQEQGS